MQTIDGEGTNNEIYRVTEDGKKLEIKENESDTDPIIFEIIELTKEKLKTKLSDEYGVLELEYNKK